MERTYIIPLRKEFQKVPTYKKSKKAAKAIKEFVMRHMHAANFEAVKVLNELNNEVWMHGIRNPPSKVKVNCKKLENGNVLVQLFGQPFPEAKKEEKKGIAAKLADKVAGKKDHDHTDHNKSAEKKPVAPAKAPAAAQQKTPDAPKTVHKASPEQKRSP